MIQPIISESHGPLSFVPSFPGGYKGPVLPGSQVFSSIGDYGTIVIQDFEGDQFNIRYVILHFFQKMILHRTEEEKLRAQFVLREKLKYKRGRSTFQVKPGEYNLIWAPGTDTEFHFLEDREYQLLQLYYDPALVRQLIPSFPDTASIRDEKRNHIIRPNYTDTVSQILNTPYTGEIRRFYYEIQVRELMFSILDPQRHSRNIKGLSEYEVSQIHKVEQMIVKDLSVHYTIPELARMINMGQFKLKAAFKQVTGMGMFECLKEARLQKSRKLLLETDMLVKHIYAEAGYESITVFIDAFRKRFGISPTEYRKKYKPDD